MSNVIAIYVKFTKSTNQIWSCHVTLASDTENFYFLPNSILNFRKSYQIWGNWLKNKKVTGKKQIGGGGVEKTRHGLGEKWIWKLRPEILPVHVPNFGGMAGSEDFACATLPTTPLIFKAKLKIFVTLPS